MKYAKVHEIEKVTLWEGYQLVVHDVTDTRSHPSFFDEYRLVTETRAFFGGAMDRQTYIDKIYQILVLSDENAKQYNPAKENDYKNIISNMFPKYTPAIKKAVGLQMDILYHIGNGYWRKAVMQPGDKVYIATFQKRPRLPLIWFAFSHNEAAGYLRLHGWARSLLTSYKYKVFRNEETPEKVGVAALSYLLDIFKPRKMYGDFLAKSISVLKHLDEEAFLRLKVLPKNQRIVSAGEPEEIEVTQKMRKAFRVYNQPQQDFDDVVIHLSANLNFCILCQAENPQFYLENLGTNVRFCGKCGLR